VLIPFFLDTSSLYHREKDIMGLGAAIENILLAIEASGLGGVWLGEIIKAREKVEEILSAHENSEFFGVVALGYPNVKKFKQRKRKELSEIIEKEFL
jgi:nitroreductase